MHAPMSRIEKINGKKRSKIRTERIEFDQIHWTSFAKKCARRRCTLLHSIKHILMCERPNENSSNDRFSDCDLSVISSNEIPTFFFFFWYWLFFFSSSAELNATLMLTEKRQHSTQRLINLFFVIVIFYRWFQIYNRWVRLCGYEVDRLAFKVLRSNCWTLNDPHSAPSDLVEKSIRFRAKTDMTVSWLTNWLTAHCKRAAIRIASSIELLSPVRSTMLLIDWIRLNLFLFVRHANAARW